MRSVKSGWALLAGAVVLAGTLAGPVRAGDQEKSDAKNVGKTAVRGTTGVGKGASKIYHESAKGIHKLIGKNAGNKETRDKHLSKAKSHDNAAHRKAKQSEEQMDKAKGSAERVGK